MDVLPIAYFDNIKRFWRRKKYQRLDDSVRERKKLRIARLGNRNQRVWKLKQSPLKLLAKFRDAYIGTLMGLAGNKTVRRLTEKKVPKGRPDPVTVSVPSNEVVDSRVVMEIYKRVVSTREQAAVTV